MSTKPNPQKTTPGTGEAAGGRSRLDPEPTPRRDFLGLAAFWSMAAAFLFAAVGMLRLPKAAVVSSPSKKFRVDLPETLPPGQAYEPPDQSVAVFRDGEGIFAISTVCTHLGCIVKPGPDGFHCPCHGSKFSEDGTVLSGPAPKPLPWLKVELQGEKLVVDAEQTVPAGTKISA